MKVIQVEFHSEESWEGFNIHLHEREWQIDYFIYGKGKYLLHDYWLKVDKNYLFIIPPFFFHQFKRDMEEKILNFSIKFFPEEDFKKFINKPMRIEINKNEFKKIFKILVGNFIIGKKDITQKYLKTLILEIKETLKNISQPNIEEKISLIDEIIEENYNIPTIKLSNIAKILNSNPQYISRKYKEIKGENIFDLIRIKRLEKGFELITETDKPLKKISKECGFKNIFYFTKSFKKYFNITPATLRKQFSKLYK